ncbi:hypothetical protein D1007_43813 [Hordeum vulgare]|nr:hypothetical protein D1007_43813 [Hordeum vulgare]
MSTTLGVWAVCDIVEEHIEVLRHRRKLPPAEFVAARVPGPENSPVPQEGEVVVLSEHFARGLGLPASKFLYDFLTHYGLQPHHLAPNAMLHLAVFVALYKDFLRIDSRLDLWSWLFFFKQSSAKYPATEGFFYVKNLDPTGDHVNVPAFFDAPPVERPNWKAELPSAAEEVNELCGRLEHMFTVEGLTAVDLLDAMVSHQIEPLGYRLHLICQMSGRHEP